MPLIDQFGNKLSDAGPREEDISVGFQRYAQWATSSDDTGISKALSTRQLQRVNNAGGFNEFVSYFPHPISYGRLSYALLRHIYETSASIRPAVDGIVREVTGMPWTVLYDDFQFHKNKKPQAVIKFLQRVNSENESLAVVLGKFMTDELVIGRGVIEKVRNARGDIMELVARNAAIFIPEISPDGKNITGYRAQAAAAPATSKLLLPQGYALDPSASRGDFYELDELIYKVYAPTTYTFMSLPIIETVINEVSLIFLATKAIAWAFMNDEIPAGVLHLGAIGDEALNRAKASFEEARGIAAGGRTKMRVMDNVDNVKWIPFQRPFVEMQLAELLPIIERIIARNFGLAAVEANLSEKGVTTAQVSLASAKSKTIVPYINMIQEMMTTEVIQEIDPDLVFYYLQRPEDATPDKANSLLNMQKAGVLTRNEVRLQLGFPLKQGADILTVQTGNEVVLLDPETGEPQYRDVQPAPGSGGPPVAAKPAKPASEPATPKEPVKKDIEIAEQHIYHHGNQDITPQEFLNSFEKAVTAELQAAAHSPAEPSIVNVTMPQQAPPIVNVEVQSAEIPAPIVNVSTPVHVSVPQQPRTTTVQKIIRDDEGRMVELIKKEVDVEEEE